MHFLEAANEGFIDLTTIYDKDEAKGAYPAVHSHHFAILGQPGGDSVSGILRGEGVGWVSYCARQPAVRKPRR